MYVHHWQSAFEMDMGALKFEMLISNILRVFPMYHCQILSNSSVSKFVSAIIVLCRLTCLLKTRLSMLTPVSTL